MVIHIALASAYADQAAARAAFDETLLGPYRGLWLTPDGEQTMAHIFTDWTDDQLEAAGWRNAGWRQAI